jgi:ABC-type multidrug transport system ATPase subunit
MNDTPSLELFDVSKRYGTHIALDGVSLEVPQGSIFGLLGPNGAGKTTLIRMVAGITGPDQGSISFFGEAMSSEHISLLGYLPEERGLYKNMRVGEQAMYFARLRDEFGTTILLSTHDMSSVDELCDHVALINNGKKILEGPVNALRENARAGRIELKFRGNLIGFTAALGAGAILHEALSLGDNIHDVVLGLPPSIPIEQFLKWATTEVDVLSCTPKVVSMDEVFLHAVNAVSNTDPS